jgi:tetratricopeptide (TPR) repeat protein
MSTDKTNRSDERPSKASASGRGPSESAWSVTGRALRSGAGALGLLAMIGIASVTIDLNQPEAIAQAPGPIPNDRAMFVSRVAILHQGEGQAAVDLVALAKPSGPTKLEEIGKTDQGLLLRELVRQAFLIAARDELGDRTRDEVLDDAVPEKSAGAVVELASIFRNDGPSRIVIRRGEGAQAELILDHSSGPIPEGAGVIAQILPIAEGLSRSGFPEALKKLGLAGSRNKWNADGTVPLGIDAALESLGFVDHFGAIRSLHEIIRADGESPERLGALARAYAQLGILTEFQWHPAHKVYKARALLYAQRLVSLQPGSAWALRNRAFVRSVIGLHKEALDDLAEASKLAGDGPRSRAPRWVEPIEAYARSENSRLEEMEGPYLKLGRLLRMLVGEFPLGTDHSLRAAQAVVLLDNDCYRAVDAMCRVGGVSNLHVATTIGPDFLTKLLPVKLGELPTLPTSVKLGLEQGQEEMTIVESLEKAGSPARDRGEPSWSALAHLIRETRFVQTVRRLLFLKEQLAVPVEDYWTQARPTVAGHRYVMFLDGCALPPKQIGAAFIDFANKLDPSDLESQEADLCWSTDRNLRDNEKNRNQTFAVCHSDAVARDLAMSLRSFLSSDPKYSVLQAKTLLAVSPDSKLAQSALLSLAWDEFKDRALAWEEKAGDSLILLATLGNHYRDLKQYDRAKTLFRRYLAISPQHSIYLSLAGIYKQEGDMEGWLKVLEEYLEKGEDKGLDHAQAQVEIAHYFMSQKRWKEATPFAEAAAETGAAWAMICAIQCYEANQEWEKGESLSKGVAERYPTNCWPKWYSFCKRTGHGEIKAAEAWTVAYLEASKGRPDLADPAAAGYFYWWSGSTKKAFETFDELYRANPHPSFGLTLMLLSDELGNKSRRDEVLTDLCTKMKDQAPKSITICERFREALNADKPLDIAAIAAILESIPIESRGNAEFLVGSFAKNRGNQELTRKYFQLAVDYPKTLDWNREIARSYLEEKKP